ncbi:hypothetical protein Vadar_018830 [Vaccinium darrowii]|uniref:Uncharacterized protein n=1 Tax=Vaccinium darrowii TaxID=229202 RepID=A0ACB7XS94_9ERIC|nr:hypothetical protein Vadar_018830 [Vaccinium darrowii]
MGMARLKWVQFLHLLSSSSLSSREKRLGLHHLKLEVSSVLRGTMQSNNVRPRRVWVPQRETTKSSASNLGPTEGPRKTEQEVPGNDSITQTVNTGPVLCETQLDASVTLPSICGTNTNTCEVGIKPFDEKRDHPRNFADDKSNETVTSLLVESQHVPIVDGQKKVQFSFGSNSRSRGADDLMASGTDSLLSHMGSLALAEMIWDGSNQPKAVTVISHDLKSSEFSQHRSG